MAYGVRRVLAEMMNYDYQAYNHAINTQKPIMFRTLKEAFAFCGGKLFKTGCGYAGTDGKYDYVVTKEG